MSYESEQIEFAKELETLKVQVEYMDKYFTANPNAKNKQYNRFGIPSESTALRWQSEKILREKYQDQQTDYSLEYLNYKILKHRKAELEYKLSLTKGQRNVSKAIDFIEGITPQHVSGRVYQVKDGDGCGTFCLWFLVIDAILCIIVGLCMEGCH